MDNMGQSHDAIALPPDLEIRVRAVAASVGESPASVMLRAIEEYVADFEDAQVAEERLEALRSGQSGTTSLEELMARYGVAD